MDGSEGTSRVPCRSAPSAGVVVDHVEGHGDAVDVKQIDHRLHLRVAGVMSAMVMGAKPLAASRRLMVVR